MRILVLATDAFGGQGGIAKYNRDLLGALCAYPGVTEVVAVPLSGAPASGAPASEADLCYGRAEQQIQIFPDGMALLGKAREL